VSGSFVNSLVTRWQTFVGRVDSARDAIAEVEANRDDVVAYLSTLRVVMEILEHARSFDQTCQEIAEALVVEIGCETCVLAIRDRPDEQFRLRGFSSQGQRLGEAEPWSSIAESTWLTTAVLIGASGQPTFYTETVGGSLAAAPEFAADAGLLGLPLRIGGEQNGVLILEYVTTPLQRFARRPALTLVADIIGGALTIARTRQSTASVLGELEREVGATRDVLSAREASLREKEDNVGRLTQALIDSNEVKRQFLGTASHELRTPLNAILGYTELLHDGIVGDVTGEQKGMLRRVLVGARHLNQLIDDMLFFVQFDAEQATLRPETFSMGDLVREVADALPERYAQSQASLQVEIAPTAETVWSDRRLLKRAIFHLLANGFKFTPTGDVTLSAGSWEAGQGVVIRVRDTGVGIPEDRLEPIFDLFRQGDMSSTRRFSGLGLGLALVQRCVSILGGTVAVQSTPGVGSEFTVHIPSTDPGLQPTDERPAPGGGQDAPDTPTARD
jgi:signal transduction histidine kinase